MDSFRWYVDHLKWADRILDTTIFEGRECVGFEINLSKFSGFPEGRTARVWFDVETKLPVRIEKHGIKSGFDAAKTSTLIHDQFEYHTEVPAHVFTPQIPEGFVNARPDDIRAAEKGEMAFADVPAGLRDEIVAAMKHTETVVYQQGNRTVYLSPNAWRYDYYSGEELRKTEWYVYEEVDTEETGFEIEDKDLRIVRTTVDFESQTYEVLAYPRSRHPIHRILFLAGLVDRADRMLENEIVDGVECMGFEISAKKYGDNPDSMIHRLWFKAESKLLVRMEFEWDTDSASKQELMQQFEREQFQWDPELDEKTFVPRIPEGFEFKR
jgi:outer membrane lipoprotein-sorting protein